MLPLRSAAAAPCSVAGLLLHRFSSYSSSTVYSVRQHASSALSSQPSTCPTITWSPSPHSSSPRIRGFAAWASAPGPAGSADSPATKALEAKIKEQLGADTVTVVDTSGDGRHVWWTPPIRSIPNLWRETCVAPSGLLLRPEHVGGQTRLISVPRAASFGDLLRKVEAVDEVSAASGGGVLLRYQLPGEDLNSLISVSGPEDYDNMMEEYEKLATAAWHDGSAKLRGENYINFLLGDGHGAICTTIPQHLD